MMLLVSDKSLVENKIILGYQGPTSFEAESAIELF